MEPGEGSKKGAKTGPPLRIAKPCFLTTLARILLFFLRRGVPFLTPKIGPKWGPDRVLDAEPLGKASWSALGRSWSQKK